MDTFSFGGGGKKRRNDFIGGRPKSDANYGPKKRFDDKPGFRGANDRTKNNRSSDRELFATTCTSCGRSCEVPFRPDGSKPVLCRDCFAKNHPAERSEFKTRNDFSRGNDRGFKKPERRDQTPASVPYDTAPVIELTKHVALLDSKLNEILTLLQDISRSSVISHSPDSTPEETTDTENGLTKKISVRKKVAKKAVKKSAKKVTRTKAE